MNVLTLYSYYTKSIFSLLTRFRRPFQIAGIFLGIPGALPAQVTVKGFDWHFKVRDAMDVWVIKETCVDGDYLWSTSLQPNWHIIDIGAGLGDFSVLAAHHCPQGVIHAYEPLAESYSLLQENLALNHYTNVSAFQLAISSAGGSQTIVSRPAGKAVSTRFAAGQGTGTVASRSLSDALKALPNGHCDFLKVDCEGCEYDLLMNSSPQELHRIRRLSIETHEFPGLPGPTALIRHLEQHNFKVETRPNPVHDYLGFLYAERTQ